MKKLMMSLLILSLACTTALGQVDLSSGIVYLNNNETVEVKAGTPVVFTNKDAPKEEFIPMAVQWKPDLEKVEFTALGGTRLRVPFVTHIPEMSVFVQVLSDQSVVVTERIMLVNTGMLSAFTRDFPKLITDAVGQQVNLSYDFLFATLNGQEQSGYQTSTDKTQMLSLFSDSGLSKGIHLIELSYEVKNALQIKQESARLFLPLIGTHNLYPIERGKVIITYPQNTKIYKVDAFYGKNNQTSDQAGSFFQDENSHLIYKMNGILPSAIDLKLDIVSSSNAFSKNADDGFFVKYARYMWIVIALIACLVLFIYLFFAALDLKDQLSDTVFMNKMRRKLKYHAALLRSFLVHKSDAKALFVGVLSLIQKGAVQVDATAKLTLVKTNKKVSDFDAKILHFLFPSFIRKQTLNALKWNTKGYEVFRKISMKTSKKLQLLFVQRELTVCAVLCIVSFIFAFLTGASVWQILSIAVIEGVFIILQLNAFYKRAHIKDGLQQLFQDYSNMPQNENRELLKNIALDQEDKIQQALTNVIPNTKMSVKEFESLFMQELTQKGEQK